MNPTVTGEFGNKNAITIIMKATHRYCIDKFENKRFTKHDSELRYAALDEFNNLSLNLNLRSTQHRDSKKSSLTTRLEPLCPALPAKHVPDSSSSASESSSKCCAQGKSLNTSGLENATKKTPYLFLSLRRVILDLPGTHVIDWGQYGGQLAGRRRFGGGRSFPL